MQSNLLKSQFNTLESPEDALVFDIEKDPSEIVNDIWEKLI